MGLLWPSLPKREYLVYLGTPVRTTNTVWVLLHLRQLCSVRLGRTKACGLAGRQVDRAPPEANQAA